jgi:polar amino acid transport system substrate-binding protein
MKRIFILFFFIFLLVGCREPKPVNQLVVGTSADYPPFEFYQDGSITGFEIELVCKLATELHKNCVINDLPFESLIGALQSKRLDIAASSFSETPDRLKKVDFSIPYHESFTVMIVHKDSSITEPEDLQEKTVGVQLGTVYEKIIKTEWLPKVSGLQLRSLSKIPDLLQDFKSGRLAALVMGKGEAQEILATSTDLKMVMIPNSSAVYALAFPKGSPLVEPVNKLLEQWKEDGTLKKLEEKWFKVK